MRHTIKNITTLLEALTELAPDSSRNTLRTWIKDSRVSVDGKRVLQPALELVPGQIITVSARPLKKEGPLTILYEDNHLIVVDKPAGLLSVSTDFETTNTAHAILKRRFKPRKVFVVHRLDQDTSGVMMFALSDEAYHFLKAELMKHDVKRHYYGLVEGHLQGKGTWTSYLFEDSKYLVHSSPRPEAGERAVTHYEAAHYHNGRTLVRFELETGKKNQIRVHTTVAGHPICGDEKYGGHAASRLFLHAFELCFLHPISKKQLQFISPLPEPFLHLLGIPKFP